MIKAFKAFVVTCALFSGVGASSPTVQVRHFTSFSYNKSAPQIDVDQFLANMSALPKEIPQILTFRLSTLEPIAGVSHDGPVLNVVAESGFASVADYLAYRSNPIHENLCPAFRKYLTSRAAVESNASNFGPGDFDSAARVLLFPKLKDGLPAEELESVVNKLRQAGRHLVPGATSVTVGPDLGIAPAPHQWNNNEFVIIASFASFEEATDPLTWTLAKKILEPHLLNSTVEFGRWPYYISVVEPKASVAEVLV